MILLKSQHPHPSEDEGGRALLLLCLQAENSSIISGGAICPGPHWTGDWTTLVTQASVELKSWRLVTMRNGYTDVSYRSLTSSLLRQSHRRRHWTLQSRPQWATRQVYPTDKMLMLLKRHFSGGREVEQVKLEEKTSRKKSDESVLSLREVTKYVVLTESRRPSISEYFRTLVSKMTINDALSWNSEEFVKQQYAGA